MTGNSYIFLILGTTTRLPLFVFDPEGDSFTVDLRNTLPNALIETIDQNNFHLVWTPDTIPNPSTDVEFVDFITHGGIDLFPLSLVDTVTSRVPVLSLTPQQGSSPLIDPAAGFQSSH